MPIILFDLSIIILSFWLLKLSGEKITRPSAPHIFLYFYLIYIALGQILTALFIEGYINNSLLFGLISKTNYMHDNIFVFTSLLSFMIGMFISSRLNINKSSNNNIKNVYCVSKLNIKLLIRILLLSQILLYILFFVFISIYQIPMFSDDFEQARFFIMDYGGYKYVLIIYLFVNPIVAAISLYFLLSMKNGIAPYNSKIKVVFLMSQLLQLTSILVGFRTFVIIHVALMVVTFSLVKKITIKKQIIFFMSALFFIIFITAIKYHNGGAELVIYKLLHRLVFDGGYSLSFIREMFDGGGFEPLYGETYLWNLNSLLPGKQMTFQNYLTYHVTGGKEWMMALAPTLPGEIYANFGSGYFLAMFLFGFISKSILDYSRKNILYRKNDTIIISLTIYYLYSLFLMRTIEGGLGAYLILLLGGIFFISLYTIMIFFRQIHKVHFLN